MIKIVGIDNDCIDDIKNEISEDVIKEVESYECSETTFDEFTITLNEEIVNLAYSKDMGIKLVKFELFDTRTLVIDSIRFREVIIR